MKNYLDLHYPISAIRIIEENLPSITQTKLSKYLYILDVFIRYKTYKRYKSHGIYLNQITLAKQLGENGNICKLLDNLQKWKIIERKGKYIPKLRSFSYKLTDNLDIESSNIRRFYAEAKNSYINKFIDNKTLYNLNIETESKKITK